jgi:hypothetical protein
MRNDIMAKKADEATGLCERVAGRKVRAGEVLVLSEDEAEYELARGLIREAGAQRRAEAAAQRLTQRR